MTTTQSDEQLDEEQPHRWRAERYRLDNGGQFVTALEALMEAGTHLHAGGRFTDVGCGSGELAAAMAQRQFTVAGNDVSASMVAAARDRCAELALDPPAEFEVQDAHDLVLAPSSAEVVHSSWMIHWLSDAGPALRAMAGAVVPGGQLVLQWSCGQPRAAGFRLREVIAEVMDRPRWRNRVAAAPLRMFHHPLEEVSALLVEQGLEVLHTVEDVQVPVAGGTPTPEAMRSALKAAAFAAQADVLGEDADAFIDEALAALIAADALHVHNTRLIARRPLAGRTGPRPSAVRSFPRSVGLLEVVSAADLSPLVRRLELRTVGSAPLAPQEPAETITLLWPAEDATLPVLPDTGRWRFPPGTPPQHSANVTLRGHRVGPSGETITVDVFRHGAGAPDAVTLAGWAADAGPGDTVGFGGSRVHFVRDPAADWTLLIGDETALSSAAAIAEALPDGHPTIVVVQLRDAAEEAALDVTPRAGLEVRFLHRGGLPAVPDSALLDAVVGLALPAGRGQVWGGAESSQIRPLRQHLREQRGLDRDQISLQGYWTAG